MTRRLVFAALTAIGAVHGQQPAQQQPPPSIMRQSAANIPDDAVVATINGRKWTKRQIAALASTMPTAKAALERDPNIFLRDIAMQVYLSEQGAKENLQDQSPYKELIEFQRMTILSNAFLNWKRNSIPVPPEEMKARYEANKAKYTQAKARLIVVPVSGGVTDAQAKASAAEAAQKARNGADFVTLAKEYSEDPGRPGAELTVTPNSQTPPEPVRKAILSAAAGTVTDPIYHDNSYYVVRIESAGVSPFESVHDQILLELQQEKFQQWFARIQSDLSVKVENEAFFRSPGR